MEVKKEIKVEDRKSSLILDNRKRITLSGVVEVVSFNEEQIILNTVLGKLIIKGQELKMHKLDVQNGDVMIIGTVNSCVYNSTESKKDKESILARLFK